LGTTRNTIEVLTKRLNSGNTCYSVSKMLSSHILSKTPMIRIYKTNFDKCTVWGMKHHLSFKGRT
jgi:hypothetical protein